jgi:hypothetical protein
MTKANRFAELAVPVERDKRGSAQGPRRLRTMFVGSWMHATRYIKENHYIFILVLVFILSGWLAVYLGTD